MIFWFIGVFIGNFQNVHLNILRKNKIRSRNCFENYFFLFDTLWILYNIIKLKFQVSTVITFKK